MSNENNRHNQTRRTVLMAIAACAMIAVLVVVAVLGQKTMALDEKPVSITVSWPGNSSEKKPDLVVDVYKVADAKNYTDKASYDLNLSPAFSSLQDEFDQLMGNTADTETDETTDITAAWKAFAQKAAIIAASDIAASDTRTITDNSVTITGGGMGLYLIIPHGDMDEDEYEVIDTDNGTFFTLAYGETLGYRFEPMLIAMPSKNASNFTDAGDRQDTFKVSDSGDWIMDAEQNNYIVNMILKYETFNIGSVRVYKVLDSYGYGANGELINPYFAFSVTVSDPDNPNGTPLISDEVRVDNFDIPSDPLRKLVLEITNVPYGSEVTIEEIAVNESYRLNVNEQNPKSVTISSDNSNVEFEFHNHYEPTTVNGGEFNNNFTYENGSWVWTEGNNTTIEVPSFSGEYSETTVLIPITD